MSNETGGPSSEVRRGSAVSIQGERVEVSGGDTAPIITFDVAPTIQTPHGGIGITLVAITTGPTEERGAMFHGRVVAVLRTSKEGAMDLIGSLQRALLALAPAANPEGPKN